MLFYPGQIFQLEGNSGKRCFDFMGGAGREFFLRGIRLINATQHRIKNFCQQIYFIPAIGFRQAFIQVISGDARNFLLKEIQRCHHFPGKEETQDPDKRAACKENDEHHGTQIIQFFLTQNIFRFDHEVASVDFLAVDFGIVFPAVDHAVVAQGSEIFIAPVHFHINHGTVDELKFFIKNQYFFFLNGVGRCGGNQFQVLDFCFIAAAGKVIGNRVNPVFQDIRKFFFPEFSKE